MSDAGVSTAYDPRIIEIYNKLKSLMKQDDELSALVLLQEGNFRRDWEALLHYSMMRRNCPITKIIMKCVIITKLMKPDKIARRVSKVDHRIQVDFYIRLRNYANSKEFEEAYSRYQDVRRTAVDEMRFGLNRELVNPNRF